MSQLPQPWLSYRRQCSQTLKHQYTTVLPLTLATTSFLPCDKRTKWPPWTKRPITHQHRAIVTKVSSRLTDKDNQPPVYQVGLGQRVYILPGALWATLGHLPPIPQHPRTPGHKAFRSQLTANELGGIRFAGLGLSGPPYNPDQPEPTPSDNQGLWGSMVGIFPQRSHTYGGRRMPMGVTSNWCHPQGHQNRRLPTIVPSWDMKIQIIHMCQETLRYLTIWLPLLSWTNTSTPSSYSFRFFEKSVIIFNLIPVRKVQYPN